MHQLLIDLGLSDKLTPRQADELTKALTTGREDGDPVPHKSFLPVATNSVLALRIAELTRSLTVADSQVIDLKNQLAMHSRITDQMGELVDFCVKRGIGDVGDEAHTACMNHIISVENHITELRRVRKGIDEARRKLTTDSEYVKGADTVVMARPDFAMAIASLQALGKSCRPAGSIPEQELSEMLTGDNSDAT